MANKKTMKKRRLQELKRLYEIYKTAPSVLTPTERETLRGAGYIQDEEDS